MLDNCQRNNTVPKHVSTSGRFLKQKSGISLWNLRIKLMKDNLNVRGKREMENFIIKIWNQGPKCQA